MIITFKSGKIIANQHELVVRLDGEQQVSMQAQIDAVKLIGRGANVVAVHASECQWSIKLDSVEQLLALADALGIDIQ